MFIQSLSDERRSTFPFGKFGPGNRFIRSFIKRHDDELGFRRPLRQEGQRWSSVNAEALTTHFACIEKLVKDYNIDTARIWNLDETGGTPGRDVVSNTSVKVVTRRNSDSDVQVPEFIRTSRATVMAVINGAGDSAPPLFVFKGS